MLWEKLLKIFEQYRQTIIWIVLELQVKKLKYYSSHQELFLISHFKK